MTRRRVGDAFVLVAGEAGFGKTALLAAFREQRAELRWWWSACDGSFTPRPLSPLYEIAFQAGGRLLALCADDADRRELFATFLEELAGSAAPTVVVVEDLHWADDATLDWLRYLSRRVTTARALVVATYRDDGSGGDEVPPVVIGQVAAHHGTRRLSLPHAVAAGGEPAGRGARRRRRPGLPAHRRGAVLRAGSAQLGAGKGASDGRRRSGRANFTVVPAGPAAAGRGGRSRPPGGRAAARGRSRP